MAWTVRVRRRRGKQVGLGFVSYRGEVLTWVGFDEDVEGFQFTRVTSKKARSSIEKFPGLNPTAENATPQQSPRRGRPRKKPLETGNDGSVDTRQSPEVVAGKKSTRANTRPTPAELEEPGSARRKDQDDAVPAEKKRKKGRPAKPKPEEVNGYVSPEQSGTAKISLPMADTPVIQRNKEMRTKKSEKGSRRSSLGMRGRRASSLIDSGTSNGGCTSAIELTDDTNGISVTA